MVIIPKPDGTEIYLTDSAASELDAFMQSLEDRKPSLPWEEAQLLRYEKAEELVMSPAQVRRVKSNRQYVETKMGKSHPDRST